MQSRQVVWSGTLNCLRLWTCWQISPCCVALILILLHQSIQYMFCTFTILTNILIFKTQLLTTIARTWCRSRAVRTYRDPLRCNPGWTPGLDPCSVQTLDRTHNTTNNHNSHNCPRRADDEWAPTARACARGWVVAVRRARRRSGVGHTLWILEQANSGSITRTAIYLRTAGSGWPPRPGKPGDSRYAYMTPTSESRLGALRRLRSSSPSQTN